MIIRIAVMGIVTVLSALVVRNERSDIAVLIVIVGGAAIVFGVLDYFVAIADMLNELADKTGLNVKIVQYLLKIVGAGYLVEFACDTAEEAKMPSLANKIAFGGKVVLFCLMIPIVKELIDVVISLLELS